MKIVCARPHFNPDQIVVLGDEQVIDIVNRKCPKSIYLLYAHPCLQIQQPQSGCLLTTTMSHSGWVIYQMACSGNVTRIKPMSGGKTALTEMKSHLH